MRKKKEQQKRRCPACREEKDPKTDFYKNRARSYGVQPYCISCEQALKQKYYQNNRLAIIKRVLENRRKADGKDNQCDQREN